MSKQSVFSIFSIQELLASPRLMPIIERLHPAAVIATVKGVCDDVSREMFSAATERRVPELADLTDKILARLQDVERRGNRLAIDASGVIFRHTPMISPLGRQTLDEMLWRLSVPLADTPDDTFLAEPAPETVERFVPTCASTAKTLCARTGAEDALFFGSCDQAETALFQTFGQKGAILTARRDMTEDTRGRRLADLMAFSAAKVIEVGASNGVNSDDFFAETENEIGLVRLAAGIHSDMKPTLSPEATRRLAERIRPQGTPILLRVDFAPLLDLSDLFSDPLPTVGEWLETGPDLLLFSSAQLIGGPDCGVLLGRRTFLDAVRRRKTAGMFLPHRVDLAGLAKTLELARLRDEALRELPILKMIATPAANLRNRAERLAPLIAAIDGVESAEAVDLAATLSLSPGFGRMASSGVAVRFARRTATEAAAQLNSASPSVFAVCDGKTVLLNLKTVLPQHDAMIVRGIETIFQKRL